MFKIIVTCDPQIDNPEKVVFEKLKEVCLLGLNHFKIEVEGTTMRFEK